MLIDKGTVRSLLCFYEVHQHERAIIEGGDIFNLNVWDKLFVWFFHEEPVDSKIIPAHHKKGSSDVRWDELLHTRMALTANAFVYKLLQRRALYKKQTEKAA